MSDEIKRDEAVATDGSAAPEEVGGIPVSDAAVLENDAAPLEQRKASKRRKRSITIGVICGILIVAFCGFWVWHEQPSFCNAICHAPMDPTGETYTGVSGQPGLDKWGNYVEDMGDLMVVQHKEGGDLACMDCHVPTIAEQVTEVVRWIPGDYLYPLNERSLTDLNAYHKYPDPATFCLNERCHNMTRDDLAKATSGSYYNPHVTADGHNQMECSDCHKAHRQSVQACTRCHTTEEVNVPDGWLSAEESVDITSANFAW